MELGLHIANFTWNGGPPEISPTLGRLARGAEAAGITRLTVMDHLWQIGGIGPPEDEMLEAYTTLGFLAGVTERVRLHVLVTAVVYREPGMLAKMVTTLDVLSGGRAGLGLGAAWNEDGSAGSRRAVPFDEGAIRAPRGDAADLRADVERRRRGVRGDALQARAHAQLATEPQPPASVSHDRGLG